MVRWNPKAHSAALRELFDNDEADPERTDSAYIDEIHSNLDNDNPLSDIDDKVIFRKHYKEKATAYLMSRAISGTRRDRE